MKLLLTHRFFWPDTVPYAAVLRAIGDTLVEAGHEVHVLSSMPSYRSETLALDAPSREVLGELHVRRIRVFGREKRNFLLRIANVLLYCWAIFVTVLRLRPEIVTASTFPPVVAAWSTSLAAQIVGARFIYHVQDIHPELSQFSGAWLGRGLPMRILRWLDNQTLRRSDAIVTLSEDMGDTLRARGLSQLPISVINNPPLHANGEAVAPPVELLKPDGTVRVIFAGNLGRFQNLPLLTEGVAQCFEDHPELELLFLGDGAALPELKRRWGDHSQVRFAPFLPFSQAKSIIGGADIGLVSLSPRIYQVAYPSKIATYRALGLRILALVEPESQLARDIERHGQGAVAKAATPHAIAEALERLIVRPSPPSKQHAEQCELASWESMLDTIGVDRQ